jgi:hypothetical protein
MAGADYVFGELRGIGALGNLRPLAHHKQSPIQGENMRKAVSNVRVIRSISGFCSSILCAAAFVLAAVAANSQEQAKPALMVLGSAHFDVPGRDFVNFEIEDVLSERRQKEIAAVVQRLAEFHPTRIAIEMAGKNQAVLDQRYLDYREGRYELGRNEAAQFGMRLAALLGHERIYAVDWNDNPPGVEADYDWPGFAAAHGQEAKVAAVMEHSKSAFPELKDQTIGQFLLQLNAPEVLNASHHTYFEIAKIGEGDALPGASWVGTWYARNLKIYSRLAGLVTEPDDRVLVIYGAGHAYLLQQFAREDGIFDVVNVEDYLKE